MNKNISNIRKNSNRRNNKNNNQVNTKQFTEQKKFSDKLVKYNNELIGKLTDDEKKKFNYLKKKEITTNMDFEMMENKTIIELILYFLQNITIFYKEVETSTNSKQSIDAFKEICIEVENMNSNISNDLCSNIFNHKLAWNQITKFKKLYDTVIEMIDLVITIKTYKNCKDCSNKELILPKNYIYLAKLLQILKIRIKIYIEKIEDWIKKAYKDRPKKPSDTFLYELIWANKLNYLLQSDIYKMSIKINSNNSNNKTQPKISKSDAIQKTYINMNGLTNYFTDLPLISKLYTLNEVNKYNEKKTSNIGSANNSTSSANTTLTSAQTAPANARASNRPYNSKSRANQYQKERKALVDSGAQTEFTGEGTGISGTSVPKVLTGGSKKKRKQRKKRKSKK